MCLLFLPGQSPNSDAESKSSGFLSSLLGAGCECDGYDVRIVGHSLGGAIATLLGIKVCHFVKACSCFNFSFLHIIFNGYYKIARCGKRMR